MKWQFNFLLVVLLVWAGTNAIAAVRISIISGNWSNAATWGGPVPSVNDEVIIAGGTEVNLNQTTPNYIGKLTIENGAVLKISVNGSGLHIGGNIENNGGLVLWNSNAIKGTLFLRKDSYWSGTGVWRLGTVNLADNGLEFDDFMVISVAGNIMSNPAASLNRVNKRTHTLLNFNGTENASMPSAGDNYYYPSIRISKEAGASRTTSFNDQATWNQIHLLGSLELVAVTDRLGVGAMNELEIAGVIAGEGTISGGQDSKLLITGTTLPGEIIRITNGTSFYNFTVSRPGLTSLANSFIVRNRLTIMEGSLLKLASNATLTLGVNGAAPAAGEIDCRGYLLAGLSSELTVRGDGSEPVELKFGQAQPGDHTLSGLTISRLANAGEVRLAESSSLILNGPLEIDDGSSLNIADGSLYLELTVTIRAGAFLTGSGRSCLYIRGSGGNATLRFNQNDLPSSRTLKLFQLERTPGRIITLANPLLIREKANIISGKLNSGGNLILMADQSGSAAIDRLTDAADIIGDVVVNSFFTGGSGMRGTRMVSSPIDDSATEKSVFSQLQEQMIITGAGGPANGFDPGGATLPYTPTIQLYNESANLSQPQFIPLPGINSRTSTSGFPGKGKGFFLFFRGSRSGPDKTVPLNGAYPPPENVVVAYKGPVNKGDILVSASFTNNAGDQYNGYNVLGNPYPAPVDWTKLEKNGVLDVINVIRPGGGMATYSNGVTINGTGLPLIQPGQAFYIRASGPGATVKFTEQCKSLSQPPARLLKTADDGNKKLPAISGLANAAPGMRSGDQLVIKLSTKAGVEETAIVFKEESSEWFDEYDAPYFPGSITAISTRSKEDIALAINFIPVPGNSSSINLVCTATSAEGILSSPVLPGDQYRVELQDSKMGKRIVLSDSTRYAFYLDQGRPPGSETNRFCIIITKQPGSTADAKLKQDPVVLYPVPAKDRINVLVAGKEIKGFRMVIYNSGGKKMAGISHPGNDVSTLPAGLYIAEIFGADGRAIGKKRFIKQ